MNPTNPWLAQLEGNIRETNESHLLIYLDRSMEIDNWKLSFRAGKRLQLMIKYIL